MANAVILARNRSTVILIDTTVRTFKTVHALTLKAVHQVCARPSIKAGIVKAVVGIDPAVFTLVADGALTEVVVMFVVTLTIVLARVGVALVGENLTGIAVETRLTHAHVRAFSV